VTQMWPNASPNLKSAKEGREIEANIGVNSRKVTTKRGRRRDAKFEGERERKRVRSRRIGVWEVRKSKVAHTAEKKLGVSKWGVRWGGGGVVRVGSGMPHQAKRSWRTCERRKGNEVNFFGGRS